MIIFVANFSNLIFMCCFVDTIHLKQNTVHSYVTYYVHARLCNTAKQMFTCQRFEAFVIKQR